MRTLFLIFNALLANMRETKVEIGFLGRVLKLFNKKQTRPCGYSPKRVLIPPHSPPIDSNRCYPASINHSVRMQGTTFRIERKSDNTSGVPTETLCLLGCEVSRSSNEYEIRPATSENDDIFVRS
ncbi:hypothetical protein EVAR_82443_1 [Eumeta japonica]|uniref:Uncharacterized protein n=1 Tax=Eumeta variegata TaxID=151549 RepID=A0A4C1YL13_EUMVA|nr:hypothetical protein EVAR_82443_1 [Eumeta japonica]